MFRSRQTLSGIFAAIAAKAPMDLLLRYTFCIQTPLNPAISGRGFRISENLVHSEEALCSANMIHAGEEHEIVAHICGLARLQHADRIPTAVTPLHHSEPWSPIRSVSKAKIIAIRGLLSRKLDISTSRGLSKPRNLQVDSND